MTCNDSAGRWREDAARGQLKLVDALRILVFKTDPALFDRLDFEDDESLLDPLLFAYFTDPAPAQPLAQLLYARIPPERRPASIEVHSDTSGSVFLPGLGELCTGGGARGLELRGEPNLACWADGRVVAGAWRAAEKIPGTAIEITSGAHPLLARFLVADDGAAVEVGEVCRQYIPHVHRACALLRDDCPAVWNDIAAVTRRIVLFRGDLPNSFATLSAHGAIFCNVTTAIDEVFFLEDIAHQAGHVLFNALTVEKEALFTVDPSTTIDSFGAEASHARTLYAAVHGLFTYTTIGEVLSACCDCVTGRKAHELLGRLGMILQKFESDIALLDRPALYTPSGLLWWQYFDGVFRRLHACHAARVGFFDYSNQPYVFSYELFAERNPLLVMEAAAR